MDPGRGGGGGVARLRPSEPGEKKQAPAGQVQSIVVPVLARTVPVPDQVVGAYGALVSETPPAATTPAPALLPDFGIGINLAYAFQWWAFALTAYVLFGYALVREVRRRADARMAHVVE